MTKPEREAYNAEFARTAALCLPREKLADEIVHRCKKDLKEARANGWSHWEFYIVVTARDDYKKDYRAAYLHQSPDGIDQVLAPDVLIRCTKKQALEIVDKLLKNFCAGRARKVLEAGT